MSRSDSVGDVAQLRQSSQPRVTGSGCRRRGPASTPVAGGFYGCIGCTGCSAADSRDDAPWAGLAGITGVDCVDDGLVGGFCRSAFLSESPTVRIVIDIMIGLMVVAAISGEHISILAAERATNRCGARAAAQLEKQAAYHTAVQSAMADQDVMLVHIDKRWFGEDVPVNVLLEGDRPWIDLAPGDLGVHPPDPVVYSESEQLLVQPDDRHVPGTGRILLRARPQRWRHTTKSMAVS